MTMDLGDSRSIASPLRARRHPGAHVEPYRIVEVALVIGAIAFLLPLLVLIALGIMATSPGPVLFRHERIGRGGQLFGCLKFRSMVNNADARLAMILAADPVARRQWEMFRKLDNDPRVTWLGRFLRRSSLDELPQLFNVLKGDMSLVGPRPIVVEELHHYGRHIHTYCNLRPGISGLWQISGRSDTTYRRRVACDRLYARRKSFAFDMKITLLTIPAVLMSRGAR